MDNRQIDICSDTGIEHAVELFWPQAAGGKATHYEVIMLRGNHAHHFCWREPPEGTPTLILLWHEEGSSKALPFPLVKEQAVEFIKGWLKEQNYGSQPDHDGDNGKAWRMFNQAWGHVEGRHYAILAVQPAWAMYGK